MLRKLFCNHEYVLLNNNYNFTNKKESIEDYIEKSKEYEYSSQIFNIICRKCNKVTKIDFIINNTYKWIKKS